MYEEQEDSMSSLKEIQALQLQSEKVFDYFEENNTAYIVMEYIDGVLLKDYLEKQGALSPDIAMTIIEPVVEALKKIHASGLYTGTIYLLQVRTR